MKNKSIYFSKIYLLFLISFFFLPTQIFSNVNPTHATPLYQEIAKIQKDYDRNTLENYVVYRLHSLDRELTLFNGSLHFIYTQMYLSQEVALAEIQEQLAILGTTIQESHQTLAIDESLRRQLSNLAESLKLIDVLYPSQEQSHAMIAAKEQGLSLLRKGFDRFKHVKIKQNAYVQQKQKTLKGSEDLLLKDLAEFASDQEQIIKYATDFENMTHATSWTKRKAACGATARAILYYFKQRHMIHENLQELMSRPHDGIDSLLAELKKNHGHHQGFLYFSDSAKLDHVFIIQQTSEGRYRVLQSFIDQYTLLANMTEHSEEMSYDQVVQFVQDLKVLVNSKQWTKKTEQLYQKLFFTLPKSYVKQEFSDKGSDFTFVELPYHLS